MNFTARLFLSCFLLTPVAWPLLSAPARAQTAPPAPAATQGAPGTSDSGELKNRLIYRTRKLLEARPAIANPDQLGAPGGFNWVILMQVARYSNSNQRLTNMRRGAQDFIEQLAQSRRAQNGAPVEDTVSVLPYHFGLLGEARGRVQPLRNYLDDTSKLKASVPSLPQDDAYQGRKWRDGHDWRASMQQTLDWMQGSDLDPKNTIFIVLDWNDLAQAPLTLADGTTPSAPATDADLVLPTNAARFKAFADAMSDAGLDPKTNLETVQVGNLEYDLAVFAAKDLKPLAASAPEKAAPVAAPAPAKNENGGASGALILLPILALAGGAAFWLMRPVAFRLDESESRQVTALPAKTLPILARQTEATGPHYRVANVNLDTDRPLVTIATDFFKGISVTNGALQARNTEGFQATPTGLKMTGQSGEFDLIDSTTNRVVTSVAIRKL